MQELIFLLLFLFDCCVNCKRFSTDECNSVRGCTYRPDYASGCIRCEDLREVDCDTLVNKTCDFRKNGKKTAKRCRSVYCNIYGDTMAEYFTDSEAEFKELCKKSNCFYSSINRRCSFGYATLVETVVPVFVVLIAFIIFVSCCCYQNDSCCCKDCCWSCCYDIRLFCKSHCCCDCCDDEKATDPNPDANPETDAGVIVRETPVNSGATGTEIGTGT